MKPRLTRRSFLKTTAAGAALSALPGCLSTPLDQRGDRPNIVFILADDLGYGELGCMGQKKIRTPNIDRLAAGGIRFTQAYSGSTVCAPSRCVLLTGRHTGHAFIRDNGRLPTEGQRPIPAGTETLGTMLKEAGYATCAIGKWGLGGPGTEGEPNRQGFDHWFGYLCQRHAHNYYPKYLWRNGDRVPVEGNTRGPTGKHYAPDLMEKEALDFVRREGSRPFFLYYATPVPHVALQAPEDSLEEYRDEWDDPPYDGKKGYIPHPSPRAAYAAMVTRMDRTVGRIIDLVEELGQEKNTIFFFSSDNGPTYAGGADSTFFESAGPFRGLKGSLYEGGIRVPLIVRWPGRIRPGSTSCHVTASQDVMPTLAAITGVRAPGEIDGISFLPALLGREGQAGHGSLYWEYRSRHVQAVRMDDWKGLYFIRKDRFELYNLAEDIGEKRNLAGSRPDVTAAIREIMKTSRTESKEFPLAEPK
jgi:arylsulfatase A